MAERVKTTRPIKTGGVIGLEQERRFRHRCRSMVVDQSRFAEEDAPP
jgi:hypothetical protein